MAAKVMISYLGKTGAGVLDTYETAKALIENGYDVYILLSEYIQEKDIWNNLSAKKIEYIRTYKGKTDYLLRSLLMKLFGKRMVRKSFGNIEFDYLYMPMLYMWSGIILKTYECKRSFVVLHDVTPHAGTSKYVTKMFFKYSQDATDVIVHSPEYKKQVKVITGKNYNRIHYYPLGDHTAYYNSISAQRRAITYPENKINFLFFGTIMEYKGLNILLDAYRIIRDQYENVSLSIVGSGDLTPYQNKLAGLKDVFIVNRFIDDAEVKSLYEKENIITVTPYINATQSGPIVLAMGYKSLVITSDCHGLKNQVGEGKYGLVFKEKDIDDLVDKMKITIKHPDICSQIIDNAWEYNKKNSWTASIGKMMKSVEEME